MYTVNKQQVKQNRQKLIIKLIAHTKTKKPLK